LGIIIRRTLDYVPRLDERNRAHRVEAAPTLLDKSIFWTGGAVLDQGQEGSCVGHGVTGEYLASPVRGKVVRYSPGISTADAGHLLAVQVYNRAKEVDEFEGVDYDGTSVRAGMLVHRERGWSTGFKWAFNVTEVRTALQDGPVVIGSAWSSDAMHDTLPTGDLGVEGDLSQGHCTVVTGYSPNYAGRGPRFRVRNSWGLDWGLKGNFYVTPAGLDAMVFKSGGEAAVAIGRHL
jgi:hypothetical protein